MNNPLAIRWMALLILEGPNLEPGISTSFYERLPGSFHTADEAMEVAQDAADKHPGAIGYSAKCVEVSHGI